MKVLIVEALIFPESEANVPLYPQERNSHIPQAVTDFADALGADFDTVTFRIEEHSD